MTTQRIADTDLTFTSQGEGRPYVLLHGGAGPRSMTGFAEALAASGDAQVIVPTHPGFDSTPRPDWLDSFGGLARLYDALLAELELDDAIVVGNSVGGWIAAEVALLGSERLAGVVLLNEGGIDVPDAPVANAFALSRDEITALSYHDPEPFRRALAELPEAQQAMMAANFGTLRAYNAASDAGIFPSLAGIKVPTLVAWGESDGLYPPQYGRALAAAIPGAQFELIAGAGHLPQLETPAALLRLLKDFSSRHPL